MRYVTSRSLTAVLAAGAACLLAVASLAPAPGTAAPASGPIPNGYYYEETGGYRILDTAEARFWSEFQRMGGISTLGYPVSRPYVEGGFRYQAFQRGVLQWRPEGNAAVLANTFDWLTTSERDEWLGSLGIPGPLQDQGNGNFNAALQERLTWLTNDAIRQHFLTNPTTRQPWPAEAAIQLYGVPQSRPEQRGPFIVQRFQRIAFQLWTESVPGMPPRGSVVGVLGGDLVKQSGILPAAAVTPETVNGSPLPGAPVPATPTPAPTATPVPAPTATPVPAPTATPTPGPSPTPRATTTPVPPPSSADLAVIARYAFDRMNALRAENGVPAMTWNDSLANLARAHAQDQATARTCSHTGSDGRSLVIRLASAGFTNLTFRGENISCGMAFGGTAREEVDRALASFMAEPSGQWNHRGNILEPNHRRAGVGIAPRPDGRGFYFVTNFVQ